MRLGSERITDFIHDLFRGQDHLLGGKGSFLLLADDAPDMGIALGIGALHVHDGHIRVEARDDHHLLAGIWIDDRAVQGVGVLQVAGSGLVHGHEGQPGGAGLQAGDHAEVRIFLPFQLAGFDRGAHDAQRAHARVAHVGEDHFAGAACATIWS